jgi:hypothetical protein
MVNGENFKLHAAELQAESKYRPHILPLPQCLFPFMSFSLVAFFYL